MLPAFVMCHVICIAMFRSKYLGVFDFVFGNTGNALANICRLASKRCSMRSLQLVQDECSGRPVVVLACLLFVEAHKFPVVLLLTILNLEGLG